MTTYLRDTTRKCTFLNSGMYTKHCLKFAASYYVPPINKFVARNVGTLIHQYVAFIEIAGIAISPSSLNRMSAHGVQTLPPNTTSCIRTYT
jgi:hypothetical protein